MRAKDYIVKNKSNIQYLDEIERVLEELRPLRDRNGDTDNEIGTTDYYKSYLTPDSTGHRPCIQNEHESINKNIAVSFRRELLRVVADDKSYGYIYYLLQSVQNRFLAFPIDCVPNRILIEESIEFCWEDLKENIESLKTTSEKIQYLEDKKTSWEQDDNYKNLQRNVTSFGEKCQSEIMKLEKLDKLKDLKKVSKFSSNLSDDCLTAIMLYLVKENLLQETNVELWLYWFNRYPIKNPAQLKLKDCSATMLANVMQHICGTYQTTTAKEAFESIKIASVSVTKYKKSAMYKAIEQIKTISKQTK